MWSHRATFSSPVSTVIIYTVGYPDQYTPEGGQRSEWTKRCDDKDEDNIVNMNNVSKI